MLYEPRPQATEKPAAAATAATAYRQKLSFDNKPKPSQPANKPTTILETWKKIQFQGTREVIEQQWQQVVQCLEQGSLYERDYQYIQVRSRTGSTRMHQITVGTHSWEVQKWHVSGRNYNYRVMTISKALCSLRRDTTNEQPTAQCAHFIAVGQKNSCSPRNKTRIKKFNKAGGTKSKYLLDLTGKLLAIAEIKYALSRDKCLGAPKPASRTVLGGWVKSVLKDAGVEASPGLGALCRSVL
ncbi:Uncharacterized protein OBRU01_21261 [Operophtera brumata]|uniref:Uncharacterized protein n=1 Tax=Operophtera brumata TaxID=104452 RepID=A0A0L7KTM1_OPEBR|nr:Uncharacterized protein OBRU01_21261 [Operophtera brumata]